MYLKSLGLLPPYALMSQVVVVENNCHFKVSNRLAADGGMLNRRCGDGLKPLLHMHDRHNRLTGIDHFQCILDLWNREGAWTLTHLPVQSSKVTRLVAIRFKFV